MPKLAESMQKKVKNKKLMLIKYGISCYERKKSEGQVPSRTSSKSQGV